MGNRLHIQTRHEIEYGSCGFNWEMDGLERLLTDAGCCIGGELDSDACGDWEITEEQFLEAVRAVEGMAPEEVAACFSEDYRSASPEDIKAETVALLKEFASTGDHHDGIYHFSWF